MAENAQKPPNGSSQNPSVSPSFVRIPGPTAEGAASSVVVNGLTLAAPELLAALEAGTIDLHQAVRAIASAPITRHELHLFASFLLSSAQHADGDRALAALVELLIARASEPEAAFIGIQLLRICSGTDSSREHLASLQEALSASVQSFIFAPETPRRHLTEMRYVLVRAFESELLHDAAAVAVQRILASDHPRLVAERKDLASHIISAANGLRAGSSRLAALKRLAAAVFATGTAPASLREAAAAESPQQKRITFLVTAQDAERRRQFGLASAIELHKAATLIGRPMTMSEYEIALTFHHGTTSAAPGNQRWLSRDEWLTAHKLVLLAIDELPSCSMGALGLLRLLATSVKVEDPSDTRVSFKRPDALDPLTRRKALREAERIAAACGASPEQLEAVAQEQAARLIDPTFLVHNPAVISLEQLALSEVEGSHALPKGNSAINLGTGDLTARLLNDSSPTLVSRLVAGDFEVLKRAEGLTLSQFRTLLDKIRPRAISDTWARLAFLDIVRAPHAEEVNVRVRTAALGALVHEARKLGKLTAALEKEVFAASAEIPSLAHIQSSQAGDDESSGAAALGQER